MPNLCRRVLPITVLTAAVVFGCGKSSKPKATLPPRQSASATASGPADDDKTRPTFTPAQADTRVTVNAIEYSFALTPVSAKGPKILFEITNAGAEKHDFEVINDKGMLVDDSGSIDPGKSYSLPIELAAGTYTVQCNLVKGNQTHAKLGMLTTYTVT